METLLARWVYVRLAQDKNILKVAVSGAVPARHGRAPALFCNYY